MSFKAAERVRETSQTVGAGTYTLAGAPTGYQPVSSIGANNYGPFFVTDGTNWEVIIGQYLAGPDRLTRDAVIASSNAGAAVNWAAGTRTIRSGWPAWIALPRYLTKSVAGGAGTTVLTQNEQRGHVLEFTGALTGNRVVEVDPTPWDYTVYNNTSGAFSLTLRVTGQSGVTIPQGKRVRVLCDGTDIRAAITDFPGAGLALSGPLDLSAPGSGQIAFPAAQNASANANTLDDYEEGTWTPSAGGSATYTLRGAAYTKIGNTVTFQYSMQVNAIGTGSGVAITGLPFTSQNTSTIGCYHPVAWGSSPNTFYQVLGQIPLNSTQINLLGVTAATASISGVTLVVGSGTTVGGTGLYYV